MFLLLVYTYILAVVAAPRATHMKYVRVRVQLFTHKVVFLSFVHATDFPTDLMCLQIYFLFHVSCPVKRGNRADSSLNASDYSSRGVQVSLPLLEGGSAIILG